jgi:hypothetical protein
VGNKTKTHIEAEDTMVLSEQLRKLSKLQTFDNRMDSLYAQGLPDDGSSRLGPKQKEFLRERRTMVRKLDDGILNRYERMRTSRIRGNAIVPVVNDVCQGCHMAVTKSLIAELLNGRSLVTCEHCGRILYLE